MSKLHELMRRVKVLEDKLVEASHDVEVSSGRLYTASGEAYDRLVADVALGRAMADITRDQIDQAKADVEAEQARLSAPAYKADIKKLEGIEKMLDKKADDIGHLYDDLRSRLADFSAICKDYDRLARSCQIVRPNTWKLASYGWIAYIHARMSRMRRYP